MITYYVDGYNLMFRLGRYGGNLRVQREKTLAELTRKIAAVGLNVVLVFDAARQAGSATRSHIGCVEIAFTDVGESADDYIINELTSHPHARSCVVVTSDVPLSRRARGCQARTETVEQFVEQLNHRYSKRQAPPVETIPKRLSTPPKPIPKAPPEAGKTAEESEAYYLYQFQTRAEKGEDSLPIQRVLTNYERWLQEFQKKREDEDGA